MKSKDYTCSITANITAKEAFDGISQFSKWWTKNIKGSSKNIDDEFIVQVGDIHYSKHKLVEIVPNKKLVWLTTESKVNWLKKDKNEWTNTKMCFEISAKGKQTQVTFTHVGLLPEVECYDNCVKAWDHYVGGSLLNFLTTGKGQPD